MTTISMSLSLNYRVHALDDGRSLNHRYSIISQLVVTVLQLLSLLPVLSLLCLFWVQLGHLAEHGRRSSKVTAYLEHSVPRLHSIPQWISSTINSSTATAQWGHTNIKVD